MSAPITPLSTRLGEWFERDPWAREARNAAEDAVRWGWAVAIVAAVAVWISRGMPSPLAAAVAVAAAAVGMAAAAARTLHRTSSSASPPERRSWAWLSARAWLTFYAAAAAVVPPLVAGAWLPVVTAVVALLWLAVATIPWRARRRLLARLRIGAAAVAGGASSGAHRGAGGPEGGAEGVHVGRVAWSADGKLQRVHVVYPATWAAHRDVRRDDLAERVLWELCGPPPATPEQARVRPDYLLTWNHIRTRLEVERMPPLPPLVPARDWGKLGGIVLGQTTPELADVTVDDGAGGPMPLALYKPGNHALVVGATQYGKSSGVRAWATDGLTRGFFPGGLWALDGKGSGSLAPLLNRENVHAIGHSAEEWRNILTEMVAPAVSRRYEEMLAWRSGTSKVKPKHPRALCILDEVQQILLSVPDLAAVLNTLARQALEANVILWVVTQRPDAADAVPGAIRDQLVDRVTFGPLSGSGAKMTFDVAGDDWHRALGVAPIQGRALTWVNGTWRPVQAPWLPMPADEPDVEALYPKRHEPLTKNWPPKDAPTPPHTPPETPPDTPPNTPPGPQSPPQNQPPADGSQNPPADSPNGAGPEEPHPAAYDPDNPYKRFGRRRK